MTPADRALRVLDVLERSGRTVTFGPAGPGRWFARVLGDGVPDILVHGEDLLDALGQLATVLALHDV